MGKNILLEKKIYLVFACISNAMNPFSINGMECSHAHFSTAEEQELPVLNINIPFPLCISPLSTTRGGWGSSITSVTFTTSYERLLYPEPSRPSVMGKHFLIFVKASSPHVTCLYCTVLSIKAINTTFFGSHDRILDSDWLKNVCYGITT